MPQESAFQNFLHELYLLLVGSVVLFLFSFYLILFIPNLILRPLARVLSRYLRPDLGDIVSCIGSAFAQADEPTFSKNTIVIQSTIKGVPSYEALIKLFEEKVLGCKLPNGSLRYPELQQSLTNWFGYKFWKWEKNFNIRDHVKCLIKDNSKMTPEEINKIGQDLVCSSFDLNLSPWDTTIVPGLIIDGQLCTMFYFRIHHALADGYSLLFLFQRVFGTGTPLPPVPPRFTSINLRYFLLLPIKVVRVFGLLAHNTVSSCMWKIPEEEKTKDYVLHVSEKIPTESIQKIKRHFGVSFTSVVFTLLSGGMHRFIKENESEEVPYELPCAITVPVRGHNEDSLVNQFSFAVTSFPVGESDPVTRLKILHQNFEDLRESPVPLIGYYVMMLHGSSFNFVGKIINNYKYAPLICTYFPQGNESYKLLGHESLEICFYIRIHNGSQGGLFCISSFRNGIRISPLFNSALMSQRNVEELCKQMVDEVQHLLKVVEEQTKKIM